MAKKIQYRVGIDVGMRSVGVAAIRIDVSPDADLNAVFSAKPIEILNAQSYIHDGGVDDEKSKSTRRANAGAYRRGRRRLKTRRKRLAKLDAQLLKLGYPVDRASEIVKQFSEGADSLFQWHARCDAAEKFIEDETERKLAVTICVRHIARHRGWRNPYSQFESLAELSETPSAFYDELKNNVEARIFSNQATCKSPSLNELFSDRPTPAQLITFAMDRINNLKIRGGAAGKNGEPIGIPMGKLHQSDYYYELNKIFKMQDVEKAEAETLMQCVFYQVNPRDVGAAASLIGKDNLQPDKPRAARASIAFQHFRILSTMANLRIETDSTCRALTESERKSLFAFLSDAKTAKSNPSWSGVADVLGIERRALKGIGGQTEDGEPISAKKAPTVTTSAVISDALQKSSLLKEWWSEASDNEKDMLLLLIDRAGVTPSVVREDPDSYCSASNILDNLDDSTLLALDNAKFETGRAAYSLDTLRKLNARMLDDGLNLHEARKAEFGVKDDWAPSADPLGTPLGNASADRVVKFVARWLKACEAKWGKPATVSIEHVREGFKSAKVADEIVRTQNKRFRDNEELRERLRIEGGSKDDQSYISAADIRKLKAIERQNGKCLYCGTTIGMDNAQIEHIIPRSVAGSSNSPANLVAVCGNCNEAKGNRLFSEYATPAQMDDAIFRVKSMLRGSAYSAREFKELQSEIIARLKQTQPDDRLGSDSFESVAWMARELRKQIEGYFGYRPIFNDEDKGDLNSGQVYVYRGWITSEARKASGLEKKLPWHGGSACKTRLDRRHHAIDAATIALMRPQVARILAERNEMRMNCEDAGSYSGEKRVASWKQYEGNKSEANLFKQWWSVQMSALGDLLIEDMKLARVLVTGDKRLRLSDMEMHSANPAKAERRKVKDALSANAINKAATPALWKALTTHPDYDSVEGLPEDENRRIRLHDRMLEPNDEIAFLAIKGELDKPETRAYQYVRGGLAAVGSNIHHIRIFRVLRGCKQNEWKFYQLRVYGVDLLKAKGDLFSFELPEYSISRRFAPKKLEDAIRAGNAQYIGWAVKGDEVDIDPTQFINGNNDIARFLSIPEFSELRKFKLCSYEDNSKIKLRPLELSKEGIDGFLARRGRDLSEEQKQSMQIILGDKGWRISIDMLMQSNPTFIRRSTLGYIRWVSKNNMPVSWQCFKRIQAKMTTL